MVDFSSTVSHNVYSPVYITARKATLTATFDPKLENDQLSSSLLRKTAVIYSSETEYPLFSFMINSTGGSKKPSVRIKIDDQSVIMLNRLVLGEKAGSWITVAAEYRYLEQREKLDKQRQSEAGNEDQDDSIYLNKLAQLDMERQTRIGIEDSVEPLLVCKFYADNWADLAPNRDTSGATMLVYYQPKSPNGKPVKHPWTVEIQQYQLSYTSEADVRKKEIAQSVCVDTHDMNKLLNRLIVDFFLWQSEGRAVDLF